MHSTISFMHNCIITSRNRAYNFIHYTLYRANDKWRLVAFWSGGAVLLIKEIYINFISETIGILIYTIKLHWWAAVPQSIYGAAALRVTTNVLSTNCCSALTNIACFETTNYSTHQSYLKISSKVRKIVSAPLYKMRIYTHIRMYYLCQQQLIRTN